LSEKNILLKNLIKILTALQM